ncbi:ABC transporter substrate-binding protein [Bradyrhizobium manausense]|nr:ABC transporter substrate-binding protein [Bradyrhizobium manausense]
MRRRGFITLLGGATVACTVGARGQSPKRPTIGFLGTVAQSSWTRSIAAFEGRLRELGWIEGRNVAAIDYRWADGRADRIAEIAAEFVRLKVDIIVTGGNAVLAIRKLTSTIPVVFAVAVDPVGSGFVDTLSRPGGNVTGLSIQGPDLAGKRTELLRELLPGLQRLAVLANVAYPAARQELAEVQVAARALGVKDVPLEIRGEQDIAPAFEGLRARAEALYIASEALVDARQVVINALALGAQLPTIWGVSGGVQSGGLMSYGASLPALFRRAADYVDQILRGAKPADLPVEQPTKFELVINLKTARALGLNVPPALLARTDEVIE